MAEVRRQDGSALGRRWSTRSRLDGRDRRLVSAILVLATVVLFFVAVGLAAHGVGFFGDILLAFFLAWLLAFIISPIVTRIVGLIPRLPRVLATVIVYTRS